MTTPTLSPPASLMSLTPQTGFIFSRKIEQICRIFRTSDEHLRPSSDVRLFLRRFHHSLFVLEQRGLGQCVVGREWGGMFSDSDEDAVAGIDLAVLLRRQRSTKP